MANRGFDFIMQNSLQPKGSVPAVQQSSNPGFDFIMQGAPQTSPLPRATSGEGSLVGDAARLFGGGAVQGAGTALSGIGQFTENAIELFDATDEVGGGNLTTRAGEWLSNYGRGIVDGMSDRTKNAIAMSQIKGNLFRPDTWDWGEDPSIVGVGGQLVQTLGQLVPIVAAGLVTGGVGAAVVGGAQGSQEQRENAYRAIDDAYEKGVLAEISPKYAELLKQGISEQNAYALVREEAGDWAQIMTLPVSALGGKLTTDILKGTGITTLAGQSLPKRILLGATEEGGQEVLEGVAGKFGVSEATGIEQNYGEDTFGDFILGAMAGGAVGAAGRSSAPERIPDMAEVTEYSDTDLGTAPAPPSEETGYDDATIPLVTPAPPDDEGGTAATGQEGVLTEREAAEQEQLGPTPLPAAPAAPRVAPEAPVSLAEQANAQPLSGSPFTIPGYTYVAPKTKGSVIGGIYKSKTNGLDYMVKEYKDAEQAKMEVLASKLLGITDWMAVAPHKTETTVDGKTVVASEMQLGAEPFNPNNPEHVQAVKEQFVVNAWLGNWDVVGEDFGNIVIVDGGQPVYVDLGGALLYRAQGEPKKLDTDSVPEMDTLLDSSINPNAAKVFGAESVGEWTIPPHEQIFNLAKQIAETDGQQVLSALAESGLSGVKQNALRVKLFKRLRYLVQQWLSPEQMNDLPDWMVTSHSQLPKLEKVFEGPTSSEANKIASQVKKVETEAEFFQKFNEQISWSYAQTGNVVETILTHPQFYDMVVNEGYEKWQVGNKLFWHSDTKKLVLFDNKDNLTPTELLEQYKLLPPILFHGTHYSKTNFVFDERTETWHAFDEFDKARAGSGSGGGDTKEGMFLTENPETAATHALGVPTDRSLNDLKKLAEWQVLPYVVNVNPYVVDYKGGLWNENKNIQLAAVARARGYNALLTVNVKDKSPYKHGLQTQLIVFEPDQNHVKSPFAKNFDPTVKSYKAKFAGLDHNYATQTTQSIDALKTELERLGLDKLMSVEWMSNPKYAGLTVKDVKGISLLLNKSIDDPQAVLRHEIIHALKYLGFFSTPEGKRMWKVLSAKVRAQGISSEVRNNYNPDEWVEEEIARFVESNPEPDGFVAKIVDRINKVFEAFGNWARGRGFTTAQDVVNDLFVANKVISDWANLTHSDATRFEHELQSTIVAAKKLGVKNPNLGQVDYFGKLVNWGWNVIQLANKNLHIPWLQEYVQRARQWHAEKTKWLAHANETIGKWNNLGADQQKALSNVLFDMEQGVFRTDKEKADGVIRKPTKAELQALFQKHGLGEAGVKVYAQIVNDFKAMLNKIEEVTMESIARSLADAPVNMQLEQAKARKEFKKLREVPYFPHARFGEFTVIVKDSKGETLYAEMFESERARKNALPAIRKKFKNHNVALSKLPREAAQYAGIPQSLLLSIKNNLKLNKAQRTALDEMMVHAMPAISFKNHFVRKSNIPGYSKNAMRAYADYFWHGANHVARIEYGPLMEELLQNGKNNISAMIQAGEDSTNRVRILDYLEAHYEQIRAPNSDWAALRSAGFMWWLGFNVKSAVLNFTQVPTVTYAHLGAHFGDARAISSMTASMAQLRTLYRSPEKAANAAQRADLELVRRGIEEGFLDESFAAELAGVAEGANIAGLLESNKVQRGVLKFNRAAGAMFQATEKVNRRVSFMAAVKLARGNPNAKYLQEVKAKFNLEFDALVQGGMAESEALAFLAGKDTVESTQFNYSAWARPQVMQGKKGAFLTFFMFTQNMLWFIGNSPGRTRYLLVLLLFAGLQGLPFAEDMEELTNLAARKIFGKDFDLELEAREMLTELMGEDGPPPDLFLDGIARYGFGLPLLGDLTGLPLPSIDMSANIGMGSPLPVISPATRAISGMAQGRDLDEVLGEFSVEAVGPTFSVPINVLRALTDSQMAFDDPKRWEKALPAAVNNVIKAKRYYDEGYERTRTGAEIIEFDRNNPTQMAEIIAQGLGFRPTRSAQTWDRIIMQREAARFWETRRRLVLSQWDWAKRQGTRADQAEMRKVIRRFNSQVPYREIKISNKTLSRSFKARERSRAKAEKGLPNAKMMNRLYKDVDKLYPETKIDLGRDKVPSGN